MDLFTQISKDIMQAMKARDKVRLEALRNIKKNFIEAKTAAGAGDELTDANALKILAKMSKQGRDAAALYRQQNRPDLAEEEEAQAVVIESYLPKQISDEELAAEIKAIVAQVGATSMRDMGKVMGVASKTLAGKADGKRIADAVKKALS